MARYIAEAAILIGAPGLEQPDLESCFAGSMRSRGGACLKFVRNDVEAWSSLISRDESERAIPLEKLLDPTIAHCIEQIQSIATALDHAPSNHGQTKALHIIYAGHGDPETGAWMLKDGKISAEQLLGEISNSYSRETRLHLNVTLDSCFASRFLISLMVACQNHPIIGTYECYASSLPDEKSFELALLGHGAFSFTRLYQGNAHVDRRQLAKAIDNNHLAEIMKGLQGVAVPNPVTLLTAGRQHAVKLTSGHHLEVEGAGYIRLSEHYGKLSLHGLYDSLYRAATAYGEEVPYSPAPA